MVSWLGAKDGQIDVLISGWMQQRDGAAAEVAPLVAGQNRECDSNENHGMNTHKSVPQASSNRVPRGAPLSSPCDLVFSCNTFVVNDVSVLREQLVAFICRHIGFLSTSFCCRVDDISMTARLNRLWCVTALYFVGLFLHTPTTKKVICILCCGDVVDPICQVKTNKG